ncbi:hypothetical protein [Microbacterium elymi]|uniref:DNA recombination protein RmuC n=1 Tax=Microbacterium elymi TaxID=2909587 RepID=A0ABY5NJ60_9MICO|nr:hypothetical protein [Microbacterium elymi]UUT35169.1 hypothetical protein L2X98_33530 [Microbacterium elymi]
MTAALIAGLFGLIAGWWGYRRLKASENQQVATQRQVQGEAQDFQQKLHDEVIDATTRKL